MGKGRLDLSAQFLSGDCLSGGSCRVTADSFPLEIGRKIDKDFVAAKVIDRNSYVWDYRKYVILILYIQSQYFYPLHHESTNAIRAIAHDTVAAESLL